MSNKKKPNGKNNEVSQTTRKKIERMAKRFNVKIKWEHMHGNCKELGHFAACYPNQITIRTNHPDYDTRGYDEYAQYRNTLRHELIHRTQCLTGYNGDTCTSCTYIDKNTKLSTKLCKKLGI